MSGTHGDRIALEVFQHLDAMAANPAAKRVVTVDRGHPDTKATLKHVVRWARVRGVAILRRVLDPAKITLHLEARR